MLSKLIFSSKAHSTNNTFEKFFMNFLTAIQSISIHENFLTVNVDATVRLVSDVSVSIFVVS